MKLVVRAGLRERREWREKMNALIDAQIRTEDAIARMSEQQKRTDEAMARMSEQQANTDGKLNSFISAVERLIKERRNGNP